MSGRLTLGWREDAALIQWARRHRKSLLVFLALPGVGNFSVTGQTVKTLDFVIQGAMSSMLQVNIPAERLKLFLILYILKCKNHSQLTV